MENNCKRLILDKNILIGTSEEKLRQFTSNHFLILPEVLTYECATAPNEREKRLLLQRFRNVIRAGAYLCPSVGLIVEKEEQQGCPYDNIEDATETNIIREASGIQWAEERAKQVKDNEMQRTEKIHKLANDIAELKESVSQFGCLGPYVKAARKKSQKDKQYFYQNYLQAIDYCLSVCTGISENWVSWHYQRLMWFYMLFFGDRKDTSMDKLEQHLQDMAYVILLCRADGLLTNDNCLSIIAKVAFPQKGIFDGLDKVPKEYICNWSQC